MAAVGIIASPAAGKDVRRLVANAGSVGDVDKIASIRRAAFGAVEGGADRLVVLDDTRHLVLRALEGSGIDVEVVDLENIGTGSDSRRAAAAMALRGDVGAVLVFGGDGTNRDVAKGWPGAPVVPLAVGTNNVFPMTIEPTIGGLAAGLVASGAVALDAVAYRAKQIRVVAEDPESGQDHVDAALVDVVLVDADFIGSRAVWHVADLRAAVFAIAEPASIGLSSIGAVLAPVGRRDLGGVAVWMGPGGVTVRAPIAPGTFDDVDIADHRSIDLDTPIVFEGPGVLAFDGERDHVLLPGERAEIRLHLDGPWVIDPVEALSIAVADEFFTVAVL